MKKKEVSAFDGIQAWLPFIKAPTDKDHVTCFVGHERESSQPESEGHSIGVEQTEAF